MRAEDSMRQTMFGLLLTLGLAGRQHSGRRAARLPSRHESIGNRTAGGGSARLLHAGQRWRVRGRQEARQTPADYINYEMEHGAFDMKELRDFMRGLVDAGPTRTGHRTPAVIVTLPILGKDPASHACELLGCATGDGRGRSWNSPLAHAREPGSREDLRRVSTLPVH